MSIIKKNSLKFFIINLFSILIVFFLFSKVYLIAGENRAILSIGNQEAKVTIKVFSSLTCPHCANFHNKVFLNLDKEFISSGKLRYEHHGFPLDLAALNAEIVVRCHNDNKKKFELLGKYYKEQKKWAVGSDINKINELLKKVGVEIDFEIEKMDNCLKNDKAQDEILNQRINAQKKYKIESTPTIIINEKKYTGKVNYNQFKKAIEKKL